MGLVHNNQQWIVDFHTHILPEIDDGSDGVNVSLNMLKILEKQGVTHICATPHYYHSQETVSSFLERRNQSFKKLKSAICCQQSNAKPQILLGAEVSFYSGISQCNELDQLCLSGTKTLLLEMPFSDWNNCQVEEVISLVLERDYRVILAHPERFMGSASYWKHMQKLTSLPIALQIDADSLLAWRNRSKVLELLQQTSYPVLGSDCHDCSRRAAHLKAGRTVIRKKLGSEFLEYIDKVGIALIETNE